MISIIICTYNRPKKVEELVFMLLEQTLIPGQIIVVDSSDELNEGLANHKHESVEYVRSSHKNQPYQRYLGYLVSKYDWLLYLDDDMEPVHKDVMDSVNRLPNETLDTVAFAVKFKDLHTDTSLAAMPKTKITKNSNHLGVLLRWLSGYPILKPGKVGWNGVRGKQPSGGYTEWFSGGAFLTRKDVIFQDFNFCLFAMFEKRIGMGEDFIIAYSIAQKGKIWATDKTLFYHNDQKDSSYSVDIKSFNRRVIYSRLYLSLEKARLTKRSKISALVNYIYYSNWRGLGLLLNLVMNPSKKRLSALKGFISGFLSSFELIQMSFIQQYDYWTAEAVKDIQ